MSTTFLSPVMRLVQGSMTLQLKKDVKGQPALDDKGQQIHECFFAGAVRKDDPGLSAFYALFDAQARASFPHLFRDAQGNPTQACTHPQFAWKVQDGDGVDAEGQSVAGKAGFAGHYIFKFATRYAPRCFNFGKYDASQQISNPDDVIKKGYFIRVSGTIDGNGVQPGTTAKPGLYLSPNLVELVAFGEPIVSGPDASQVFGAAPAITQLPAGASTTPLLPAPGAAASGLAPPPLPGITPQALPGVGVPAGLPGLPTAAPTGLPAGLPGQAALPLPGAALPVPRNIPMPGAAAAVPQYQMTASAQGATREQLLAIPGWTDEALIAAGHMVRVA